MMGLERPVRAPRPANSDNAHSDEEWGITTRRAKRQGAAGGRQVAPARQSQIGLADSGTQCAHVPCTSDGGTFPKGHHRLWQVAVLS